MSNGRLDPKEPLSDQCVTATAAAGSGVTATVTAPGTGLRQYITRIRIEKFAAALLTAAAVPVTVTTTGIPGTPTINFSAGAEAQGTMQVADLDFTAAPIEASADNSAPTVVAPATTAVIWRVTVWWRNR